jgi:hypothetical protein
MPAQVEGLRTLTRTLKRAGDDLADLKDANQAAARLVTTAAVSDAPKKTGKLAATGRPNRAAARAIVQFGGARAVYAPVIHWGWWKRGIPPKPFASLAAQRTESQWVPIYEAAVAQIVSQIQGA